MMERILREQAEAARYLRDPQACIDYVPAVSRRHSLHGHTVLPEVGGSAPNSATNSQSLAVG